MPIPQNTLPMMTGKGPSGPIGMGGMFTVFKVRDNLARNDYYDPGWYRHLAGTAARGIAGDMPPATSVPPNMSSPADVEMTVRKPQSHNH